MEITKELLFKGKPTVIKDKEFLSTKEYVEDFFNTMAKFTQKFIINVSTPSQITITNKQEDITFNKVWIQAIIPSSEPFQEVINLTYALDIKKPTYKVFRTYINEGCHFVFNKNWMQINEIKENEKFQYDIEALMKMTNDIDVKIRKMKNTFFDQKKQHSLFGILMERALLFEEENVSGKVKLSPNIILKAYENVYLDTTSKFYIKNQEVSAYNMYIAIAEQIKDGAKKDMVTVFEKSVLAATLFKLV